MIETQETVHRWIDETFPGTDPESPRKALRALTEMVELCLASGASPAEVMGTCREAIDDAYPDDNSGDWGRRRHEPANIPKEAADVLIVLYGVAGMRGFDLHEEVDLKMAVNRYERAWIPHGDGTGRHAPPEPPSMDAIVAASKRLWERWIGQSPDASRSWVQAIVTNGSGILIYTRHAPLPTQTYESVRLAEGVPIEIKHIGDVRVGPPE